MTPREIADGLTPAQREVVRFYFRIGDTMWRLGPVRTRAALIRKGVMLRTSDRDYDCVWGLTDLGREVAAELGDSQ